MRSDIPEGNLQVDQIDSSIPDWQTLALPPAHILAHLTDAHCHPADLDLKASDYASTSVQLGGLAAMATEPENQDKVMKLSEEYSWISKHPSRVEKSHLESSSSIPTSSSQEDQRPKVMACFGYHPWFTHRYTLSPTPPTKEEHYTSLFFKPNSSPTSKNRLLLQTLLPYFPDPIPFGPLLEQVRSDITTAKNRGHHVMVGEIGLDGGARVRWPVRARHLYTEKYGENKGSEEILDDQGEWKRLTPFKVSLEHQKNLMKRQLDIAVEMGVNVSVHSVAAAGSTMEVLIEMRDKHRTNFTNNINIDLHSAGGWSPEFWYQAEKQLSNLYASPSILITGRSDSADKLIAAIHPDRILVESDSHDVRLTTKLVWAATTWIARVKGWELEGQDTPPWVYDSQADDEDDKVDARGRIVSEIEKKSWTVKTLERNWARFVSRTS